MLLEGLEEGYLWFLKLWDLKNGPNEAWEYGLFVLSRLYSGQRLDTTIFKTTCFVLLKSVIGSENSGSVYGVSMLGKSGSMLSLEEPF